MLFEFSCLICIIQSCIGIIISFINLFLKFVLIFTDEIPEFILHFLRIFSNLEFFYFLVFWESSLTWNLFNFFAFLGIFSILELPH